MRMTARLATRWSGAGRPVEQRGCQGLTPPSHGLERLSGPRKGRARPDGCQPMESRHDRPRGLSAGDGLDSPSRQYN
jgi:hypothetical protein